MIIIKVFTRFILAVIIAICFVPTLILVFVLGVLQLTKAYKGVLNVYINGFDNLRKWLKLKEVI
jgi:hypothetical protein